MKDSQAEGRRKNHKRLDRRPWDKAWKLVQFWYAQMAKEGTVNYTVSGQKVSVAVQQDVGERDTLAQAKKDRPENWTTPTRKDETGVQVETLTADGRERRYIFPQDDDDVGFWHGDGALVVRASRRVVVDGQESIEYRDWEVPLAERMRYARSVMQTVAKLSREAHMVLEMRAATWDFPAICEEVGCGDPTARQYFSEGMGMVMAHQHMAKPGF